MNGLPLPTPLKLPCVMSLTRLAASVHVGKSTVPQTVSYRDISRLSGNAKNHHDGRCHHPAAHEVVA
jgi:hypothetical protein